MLKNCMKTIGLEQATLEICLTDAQRERVVITREGKPFALIIGLEGLDEEQLELEYSDKFWKLIEQRRKQRTMSRAELEEMLDNKM